MRPLILAASLLAVVGAHAQTVPEPSTFGATPTREIVLQWLHSPDSRLQAWAARDMLVHGFTNLVPDLQAQLERTTSARYQMQGVFPAVALPLRGSTR